jgi:hypothetical protein
MKARQKRHEADQASREEAARVIVEWNARLASGRHTWWSPTIRAALVAGFPWLEVWCLGAVPRRQPTRSTAYPCDVGDGVEIALARCRLLNQKRRTLVRTRSQEVMEAPNFTDMSPEDVLTLIENATKALDQKIAAEKADIEERQVRLAKLEARRAGKDVKPASKSAPKPRGRPAKVSPPKVAEQAEPEAAVTN